MIAPVCVVSGGCVAPATWGVSPPWPTGWSEAPGCKRDFSNITTLLWAFNFLRWVRADNYQRMFNERGQARRRNFASWGRCLPSEARCLARNGGLATKDANGRNPQPETRSQQINRNARPLSG